MANAFDAKEWETAFNSAQGKTVEDGELFAAVMWIASEAASLRPLLQALEVNQLTATLSTILAVAAINRDYKTATALLDEASRTAIDEGALSLEYLANQSIGGGVQGDSMTAPGAVEAVVDGVGSWLFDSFRGRGGKQPPQSLLHVAMEATRAYTHRYALSHLWNTALWEGGKIEDTADGPVWSPLDRNLSTRIDAWQARQEANFMNYPIVDRSLWIKLSPEERRRWLKFRTVLRAPRRIAWSGIQRQ